MRFISRSQWLAQPPEADLFNLDLPSNRVIIAHTATENCSNQVSTNISASLSTEKYPNSLYDIHEKVCHTSSFNSVCMITNMNCTISTIIEGAIYIYKPLKFLQKVPSKKYYLVFKAYLYLLTYFKKQEL